MTKSDSNFSCGSSRLALPGMASVLLLLAGTLAVAQEDGSVCTTTDPIYKIQGAGHVSPIVGETVSTCGVVTAVAFNGFYLQDLVGDGDDLTSDAVYVALRGDKPPVGALVNISATVSELIGGGPDTGNLSVTTLTDSTSVQILNESELPASVIVGRGGRLPPSALVISPDETQPPINLQVAEDAAATPFNPESDGIDFYESLEGMLVSVNNPVAISAIRQFGRFSAEVFTLADDGQDATPQTGRTSRGGILVGSDIDNRGDQNPERIQIQFDDTLYGGSPFPAIQVGDRLDNVGGVMSYSFGNFEVIQLGPLDVMAGSLMPETAAPPADASSLRVASYNVLNLSAVDGDDDQRTLVAQHIATNLGAPDIVALQEVQDNNGDIGDCPRGEPEDCSNDLDASQTMQALVDAIVSAGGPDYSFVVLDPLLETTDDNRDNPDTFGGASLGNIRNAFLYNSPRILLDSARHVSRDVLIARGVSVPNAFDGSRDPLEADFDFNGQKIRIYNNHFSSRFGSSPVFGGPQPFIQAGEISRAEQSLAMHELVVADLSNDPDAKVMVLGDLNTFEFTDELAEVLPSAILPNALTNLHSTDQSGAAYSFIFEGNSQSLDHIFVSPALSNLASVDYVHVNVDFPRLISSVVGSDHEPLLASINFAPAVESLGLRGDVYSRSALELFWNRIAGVDQYAVYRDGQLLGTTDGTSFYNDGLSAGTDYSYRVVSLIQGAPQGEQTIQLTTRGDNAVPSFLPELNVSGAVYSSTALEIFWTLESTDVAVVSFTVVRDGVAVVTTDGRSFFEEGLQGDTLYTYDIVALSPDGVQSRPFNIKLRTNVAGGSSTPSMPSSVSSLDGLVYSRTAVEIFWQAASSSTPIAGYDVFRNEQLVSSADARSFFDSGLNPDTQYEYAVQAFDINNVRGPLTQVTLRTRDQ